MGKSFTSPWARVIGVVRRAVWPYSLGQNSWGQEKVRRRQGVKRTRVPSSLARCAPLSPRGRCPCWGRGRRIWGLSCHPHCQGGAGSPAFHLSPHAVVPLCAVRRQLAKSLGQAGEIEPETEGILTEYGVDFSDFPSEVLECLPQGLPWTIPPEEFRKRRDLR